MQSKLGFWVGLGLGLAFSLGFAVASWTTPHAQAQSAPVTRWTYHTVHHGWDNGRWAAEMGAQGWRFVGFEYGNAHVLIFERAGR